MAEDGVDTVAEAAEQGTPARPRVPFRRPIGCQQGQASLTQLLSQRGSPVVAVTHQYSSGICSKFWDNAPFMDVSRSYDEAGDQPRPTQAHVDPEAVESLPTQDILAESRLTSETVAPVGPGELADRKGEAIYQSEGGIVSYGIEEPLPHPLLYLPKVGCLAHESGSMDSS